MSQELGQMNVKIGADIKSFSDGVKAVMKELQNLEKNSASAKTALSGLTINSSLETSITGVNTQLKELQKTAGAVSGQVKSISQGFGSIKAPGTKALTDFQKNVAKVSQSTQKIQETSTASVAKSYQSLYKSATHSVKGLGDSVKAIPGPSVKGFKTFQSETEKAGKAVNSVAKDVNKVGKEVENIPSAGDQIIKGLNANSVLYAFEDLFRNIGKIANAGLAMITMPALFLGKTAAREYANNFEMRERFDMLYGDLADDMRKYAEDSYKMYDKNILENMTSLSHVMSLTKAQGFDTDTASILSQAITEMSYDMAAFWDTDVAHAMQSIEQGVLNNMPRQLKMNYGVSLNEENVKEWAMDNGYLEKGKDMGFEEEKIIRLMMLQQMMQNQGSVGRHAIEVGRLAQQWRATEQQWKMVKDKLGEAVAPMALNLIGQIRSVMTWFENLPIESIQLMIDKVISFSKAMIQLKAISIGGGAITGIFQTINRLRKPLGAVGGLMKGLFVGIKAYSLTAHTGLATLLQGLGGVGSSVLILGKNMLSIFLGVTPALMLFLGVLATAEDTSITKADSIGDHFAALAVRVGATFEFWALTLRAQLNIMLGVVAISIEWMMRRFSDLLTNVGSVASSLGDTELGDALGIDKLAIGILNGAESVSSAADILAKVRKDFSEDTIESMNAVMDKMDNPMDYVNYKQMMEDDSERVINRFKKELMSTARTASDKQKISRMTDDEILANPEFRKAALTDYAERQKEESGFGLIQGAIDAIKNPKQYETEGEIPEAYITDWEAILKSLEEGGDNTADGIESAAQKIKDAMGEVRDAFLSTTDALADQIGMFDRFRIRATSTYRLLRNAREREKAYSERETILNSLSTRGLDTIMMDKISSLGIDQLGDIKGLSRMSDAQLSEWIRLQGVTNESISRQATTQTYNNYITIDAKEADAEEVAAIIFTKLESKGIRFA